MIHRNDISSNAGPTTPTTLYGAIGPTAPKRGRMLSCLLLILVAVFLFGCDVEVYKGLTEPQVNSMLSALLRRNIQAKKTDGGKNGFTLAVDERQLIQALDILKENGLPREDFQSLGSVFSGQGMVASPTEEQARKAFAISQELSDTFSRIDGVLTSRVHVVLMEIDQATDARTPPSAAVFLRHTPDSPAVNLVSRIRELTAKAVPGLAFEQVSVMLLPVRESVSVPARPKTTFLGIPTGPENTPTYLLLATYVLITLIAVGSLGAGAHYALKRKKRLAAAGEAEAGDE